MGDVIVGFPLATLTKLAEMSASGCSQESFICNKCGGVVPLGRKEAHVQRWCPALEAESDSDAELGRGTNPKLVMGGVLAACSPLYLDEVTVQIGSKPLMEFTMEQRSMWGDLGTGGVLWYSDRVMAEYLAMHDASEARRGTALVLGCGGLPLSGLVASALGWDVVATDLDPVIDLAKKNVGRNVDVIRFCRAANGGDNQTLFPVFKMEELWFGELDALNQLLSPCNVSDEKPLLILCSDCVWQEFLHAPLLDTVSVALHAAPRGAGQALLLFETRTPAMEKRFVHMLGVDELDLDVVPIDTGPVLQRVIWPTLIRESFQRCPYLPDRFNLYRLTARFGPLYSPPKRKHERRFAGLDFDP